MAGSYGHVDPTYNGSWRMIENMGDAYECVEELLYLVRCFADDKEIEEALKHFYSFKRGERDPAELSGGGPEFEMPPSITDYGRAYIETTRVMDEDLMYNDEER